MELNVKKSNLIKLKLHAYKHKKGLKSDWCAVGEFNHNERYHDSKMCEVIDISKEISKHLQKGKEYVISVKIVEKINDDSQATDCI